jgi:hypothetical protein
MSGGRFHPRIYEEMEGTSEAGFRATFVTFQCRAPRFVKWKYMRKL